MRKLWISGVAVGLLLATSACASANHSVTVESGAAPATAVAARRSVLAASATTSALTTGRFTVTTAITGGTAGLQTAVTMTGAFDRAAKSTEVQITQPASLADYSSIEVDGVVYLKVGDAGSMLGVKTPWVSIDLARFASGHGLASKFPATSPGNDPQTLLELLRGVSAQVTTVGPEQVAGVATTHYRASVLPSKALAELPAAEQSELDQALGSLGGSVGAQVNQALDTPITVDVWIDSSHRVLKGTETVTEPAVGTIATTYQLSDLGKPVAIAAPPAADVTPVADLPLFASLFGGH